MKFFQKTILLFMLIYIPLWAGEPESGFSSISGYVYDQSNGEALIGANIFLQGMNRGASTNVSGFFVIPKLMPGKYTLICRYIGFQTWKKEIVLTIVAPEPLKIDLQPQILQAEEVVVTAEKKRTIDKLFSRPVSQVEMNARDINAIPQIAEADLLRALQTLPGILPVSDFSSALYIRGGTPDQNLYLIDGADVYNPEHAFGIFSTFNTDAIKSVELSKGGFGAEYGGRLSSVLDITNLDGNRKEFEGTASISLLSAKTTLQMPLGNFGSISGSFRRTYFDKTLGRKFDEIPDYYFYDSNFKAFLDFGPRNKLTLSWFNSYDDLNVSFNPDAEVDAGFLYNWGNTTGSLRWTHLFSPQLFSNFWVTGSRFSSKFKFENVVDVDELNEISDFTIKANLQYYHSKKFNASFGFEHKFLDGRYRQSWPGGKVDAGNKPEYLSGYFALSWRPSVLWEINTGLRMHYFNSKKDYYNPSPRFAVKYRASDTINLKLAAGRYHQYLHRITRPFFADIWTTSNEFQRQSDATHMILGFEKEIGEFYSLEIETYYKDYHNLYSLDQNLGAKVTPTYYENDEPVYATTEGLFNKGKGYSRGLELLLRKNSGAITGWFGYSLAATKYTIAEINQGKEFAPRHDRSSTVNFVTNIDVKNAWRNFRGHNHKRDKGRYTLGINLVYSSGQPITTPSSVYITNTMPDIIGTAGFGGDSRFSAFALYPTSINKYRLPAYSRLDISLTYFRRYKGWSMAPYLQIFNAGNRKNVWFIQYNDESTEDSIVQNVDETNMLPLLPTIGIKFEF